jgi:hypothetical protein
MKKHGLSALVALFLLVSTAHAEDIRITPGTGGIGFNPPVTTVPEPSTFILVASLLAILIVLNVVLGLRCFTKMEESDRKKRALR